MIPRYSIPASGTTTDNPHRQTVGTVKAGSDRSGMPLLSGTEGRSSFFQLLSGELSLARSGRSESEDKQLRNMPADKRSADQENNRADSLSNESKSSPGTVQGTDFSPLDTAPIPKPELLEGGLLAGALTSWGGFASLIQLGDPIALVGTSTAGISQVGELPPGMAAGLAADIASGFTEKNGVQTLTLNLEPDHFGRVEVRLQAKGDHLSVRLTASNPEAESALRENLKELTEGIQIRTGRFHQVEVRIELRESPDPEKDPAEKDRRDFQGQDPSGKQDPDPARDNDSGGKRYNQVDTEPDQRAQGG